MSCYKAGRLVRGGGLSLFSSLGSGAMYPEPFCDGGPYRESGRRRTRISLAYAEQRFPNVLLPRDIEKPSERKSRAENENVGRPFPEVDSSRQQDFHDERSYKLTSGIAQFSAGRTTDEGTLLWR